MTENEKREKVIKGLECCSSEEDKCLVCPYYGVCYVTQKFPFWAIFADAIALQKVQEPKTVQVIGNVGLSDVKFADCPWCAMRIHDDESQHYCGHCGRAVKWE